MKKGLSRRLTDIEHERRRAKSEVPYISTSGVSASYLTTGHEYWAPMDPIYYHEKSCCFRNTYSRCPLFKRRIEIGWTEPRFEQTYIRFTFYLVVEFSVLLYLKLYLEALKI